MEIMKDKKHLPMYGVGPFLCRCDHRSDGCGGDCRPYRVFLKTESYRDRKCPSVVIGVLLIILGHTSGMAQYFVQKSMMDSK